MISTPEEVDRELARLGARGHRAVVAGLIREGERLCRGWSASGEAPDRSALFEIGSITKAFTGVLLADMVLRAEVSLEDPLSRHLPGLRPLWRYREPTLLELATHRSGLPNTPRAMNRGELAYTLGFARRDPWAAVTAANYRGLVSQESPRRAPGGRVGYSSMAVGLLGDALAAVASMSYEHLLTERVLAPLGMSATAVTIPPERVDRLMVGHSRRGRPRPPIQDFMPAAGSLRSSVDDMVRFLAACLQPPDGALGAALHFAQQPRARMGGGQQVGLCWFIVTRRERPRVVWHNGGTWGFRSFAGFAPEQGTAAVVMSNTSRSVDRLGLCLVQSAATPVP